MEPACRSTVLSRHAVGTALLLLVTSPACTVRDGGWNNLAGGTADPAALCGPPVGGCPACSTPDGHACRDTHYSSSFRCVSAGDGRCESRGGTCNEGRCVFKDRDGDGLDDDFESEVAEANLPAIALHPDETCGAPTGIVYRARRHPDQPTRLSIAYVVLYDRDCGQLNGHLGDNEAFAITVDPDVEPGAAATVGVLTQAHRGTACESDSTCSAVPGSSACATATPGGGPPRVIVYSSREKHGNYLDIATCGGNCFDTCADGPLVSAALLDLGQPEAPLSNDLTTAGLVTAAKGWEAPLLHFDPWSTGDFGGAGVMRNQLIDLVAPAGD